MRAVCIGMVLFGIWLGGASKARAQRCIERVLCVIERRQGDAVHIFVHNFQKEPVSVVFDAEFENMTASVRFPHEGVYAGQSRTHAFTLRPTNNLRSWEYSYSFEARPVKRTHYDCVARGLCVGWEQQTDTLYFFVDNQLPAEVSVRFEVDGTNVASDVPFPHVSTYPGRRKTLAFRVWSSQRTRTWKSPYTFEWMYGSVQAQRDDRYVYALPYAPGTEHRVGQGYDGAFSHASTYAVDWTMPEGTPVHAAREGIVVAVQDTNWAGGVEEKFKALANRILIRHDDGTVALYAHLRYRGALVRVGDRVRRGQRIGYSGNTGYSKGPHLHFEVFTLTRDLERQTHPVTFRSGGRRIVPEQGKTYVSDG